MLKKNIVISLCLVVILLLSACSNQRNTNINKENNNNSEVTAQSTNVSLLSVNDVDESTLGDVMSLKNYVVSIPYNINSETKINNTIGIYGSISVNGSAEAVTNMLEGKFAKVVLYSNNSIFATSTSYTVETSPAEKGFKFVLNLTVGDLSDKTTEMQITKIEFQSKSGHILELVPDCFYITPYSQLKNNVSVIDSPIAPSGHLDTNKSFRCSYIFMTYNPVFNENFESNLSYPSTLNNYLKISDIKVLENKDMRDDLLKSLSTDLTTQQKQALKVYNVDVTYQKLTNDHIVMQPLLNLNIINQEQKIGPFCILSLY